MKKESGFTLIELMIVIAIIGILAAVAVPAYTDYLARAQVSEPVELMGALKTPVLEYYGNNGAWPTVTLATDISATTAGKYTLRIVSSIGVVGAGTAAFGAGSSYALIATMKGAGAVNPKLVGSTLGLYTANALDFACTAPATGGIAAQFLPASCK